MLQLQFGPQQIRDFQIIRDAGPSILSLAAQTFAISGSIPLQPGKLFPAIKDSLNSNHEVAEAITRQCLSLHSLMRQTAANLNETIEGVTAAIQQDSQWTEPELNKWAETAPAFKRVMEIPAFTAVARAMELSYDYANLYKSGRILTDIRPLFSSNTETIEGAVVSFTLRLRFDNVDGSHDISIAMDEPDIHNLLSQCQRALSKANTSRKLMESVSVTTIVTGEHVDD